MLKQNKGFTLVEILVALVIFSIVTTAFAATFRAQQRSYIIQDQVAEMQQNIRVGLDTLEREIRMAGYDPEEQFDAGITQADPDTIIFTKDDENGNLETITYTCNNNGNHDLERDVDGTGTERIAENIEALGFAYAFDTNDDGILDKSPNGNVIWAVDSNGDGNWDRLDMDDNGIIDDDDSPSPGQRTTESLMGVGTGISVNVDRIRAVKIWLLARSEDSQRHKDTYFNNPFIYVVGNQKFTFNDNLRRRLMEVTATCRNLEL